jgi:hypothetical protein
VREVSILAKVNPFEKKDKAADKKAGVKENGKKDLKLDIKMMAAKTPKGKTTAKPAEKAKGKY